MRRGQINIGDLEPPDFDGVWWATFCRLCLDAAPEGAVKVIKLYDDGALLG